MELAQKRFTNPSWTTLPACQPCEAAQLGACGTRRWLDSIKEMHCVVVQELEEVNYEWRRLQTHEAQAERQKKNLLQKALVFHHRALQLSLNDMGLKELMFNNWPLEVEWGLYLQELFQDRSHQILSSNTIKQHTPAAGTPQVWRVSGSHEECISPWDPGIQRLWHCIVESKVQNR